MKVVRLGPLLAALLLPLAAAAAGCQALFPAAAGPPVVDRAVTLKLTTGGEVSLTSVRFAPLPGRGPLFNSFWCGLVIKSAGHPDQGLPVIGQPGPTETSSCLRLKAAGPIGALAGAPRIGLLYVVNSQNEEGVTASVIVFDSKAGLWKNDDAASNYLTQIDGAPSLTWMRRALGNGDGQ
jgi:hypothetical protein